MLRLIFLFVSFQLVFAQEKKQEFVSLLTDMDVQIDMTDAVNNMYNFKFPAAEVEFLKLRDKYPQHPMPYFLMGLSNFWKMQPNDEDLQYDNAFLAYMDSCIKYAEPMAESKDEKIQVESAFFLSASYGFRGRIHAERKRMFSAIPDGKKAMQYMQKSRNNGDLSPEFMFGDGLYNYFMAWFSESYPIFKPIIVLFPKGDKRLGMEQLSFCSNNAFFTRTEAQAYLLDIYHWENNTKAAIGVGKYLHSIFPDNPVFARKYCRYVFSTGNFVETKKIALEMIAKIDSGYVGYEEISGRYASYMLGYIFEFEKNTEMAKTYFKRSVEYSEKIKAVKMAYYLHACARLGRILAKEGKNEEACFYYQKVKKHAPKSEEEKILDEAQAFIKTNKCRK